MTKDWNNKVLTGLWEMLPKKYFDGSYIEHRVCSDEFSEDDMNKNIYYLTDILPGQLSCKWRDTDKKYRFSTGECTTISLMDDFQVYNEKAYIITTLLIAYFHDLDLILCQCLPGKTIGKVHRRNTNRITSFKRSTCGYGWPDYWHKNCKKYLPLQKSDLDTIKAELMQMSEKKRIELYDSDDVSRFVDHFCRVIEMAFDTKEISLKTFSRDACEAAFDLLESDTIKKP